VSGQVVGNHGSLELLWNSAFEKRFSEKEIIEMHTSLNKEWELMSCVVGLGKTPYKDPTPYQRRLIEGGKDLTVNEISREAFRRLKGREVTKLLDSKVAPFNAPSPFQKILGTLELAFYHGLSRAIILRLLEAKATPVRFQAMDAGDALSTVLVGNTHYSNATTLEIVTALFAAKAEVTQPVEKTPGSLDIALAGRRDIDVIRLLIENRAQATLATLSLAERAGEHQEIIQLITSAVPKAELTLSIEPLVSSPAEQQPLLPPTAAVSSQPAEEMPKLENVDVIEEPAEVEAPSAEVRSDLPSPALRFCTCLDDILPAFLVNVLESLCSCFQEIYQTIANLFSDSND